MLIDFQAIKRSRQVDAHGPTFGRGDVFYSMEGKDRKIAPGTDGFILIDCSDGMGRIGQDQNPAEFPLGIRGGVKQGFYFRVVDQLHQWLIIGWPARYVHRDDGLRFAGNLGSDLFNIEIEIRSAIDQDRGCAQVHNHEGCGGIRISRDDYFIGPGYTKPMQQQHQTGSGRVTTRHMRKAGLLFHQFLQCQNPGARSNPPGIKCFQYFTLDVVIDVGRGKGYIHNEQN